MAGEWIKMRIDLASDPAVVRIRRATGLDADSVVLGVDAATYDKFAVGQVVPFEVLAGLQVFARPAESATPAPLSLAE